MKKKITLFFVFVFIFSLCACTKINDKEINDDLFIASMNALPEEYKNFHVSNEYLTDINCDGKDDKVLLYTDAELTKDGLNKNDGNNWSLVVCDSSGEQFYELFKDYVQLGNVYFQVADYFIENKAVPVITFFESTGAVLKIINYTFKEGKGFLKENIYDSSVKSRSGINLKYSTIPVY